MTQREREDDFVVMIQSEGQYINIFFLLLSIFFILLNLKPQPLDSNKLNLTS